MLQCQQNRIFTHFRFNDVWSNLDWTKKNPIDLPFVIPLNLWFNVQIMVLGTRIVVHMTIEGKKINVLDSHLLSSPPAPTQYMKGSVGFREYDKEHACFRHIYLKKLCQSIKI